MYPHERSLVKRFDGSRFALLGVNSDPDRGELKTTLEKEAITWRSWWDGGNTSGPIATAYNVSSWPTIYVLDPKGIIRYIGVRDKDLDNSIETLMRELEQEGNP